MSDQDILDILDGKIVKANSNKISSMISHTYNFFIFINLTEGNTYYQDGSFNKQKKKMSWGYRSIQNIDIRSHIENCIAYTMHTLQLRMSTINNQLFESKKFFEKTLRKKSENMVYQDNLNYLSCFPNWSTK